VNYDLKVFKIFFYKHSTNIMKQILEQSIFIGFS